MTYQEYRCTTCAKLLFKGILVDSQVEVKCRGCGNVSTFNGVAKEKLICLVAQCAGRDRAREKLGMAEAEK